MNDKLDNVLSKLRVVKQESDGSYLCYCPVHEAAGDHNPSFVVTQADDGKILLNCRSRGCDWNDIIRAMGITGKDLFPDRDPPPPPQVNGVKPELVEWYDYADSDGAIVFRKERYEPGFTPDKDKDFKLKKPDGKGGWIESIKGCERVLYNLPAVMRAAPKVPILLVEGEKAANYLAARGFVATCNFDGAGKKPLKSYIECLSDRHVVLIPDNDEAGERHASKWLPELYGKVKSLHRLDLPNSGHKWGPDDWLDPQKGGHSVDEFKQLLIDCSQREWTPPGTEHVNGHTPPTVNGSEIKIDDLLTSDRRILDEIGLSYVAEDEHDGSVMLFSGNCSKFAPVRDVSKLSYTKLLQIVGPKCKVLVHQSDEEITGRHAFKDVKNAIAAVASVNQLSEILGAGVWAGDEGRILVVSHGGVMVLHSDGRVEQSTAPYHDSRLFDVGSGVNWTSLDDLGRRVQGLTSESRAEIVEQVESLIGNWKFDGEGRCEVYPKIIAGMVLASFVQSLWEWRPQVFLVGKPGAGKSLLMKAIASMFGELSLLSSGSTAAGIRISLGQSAMVPMCDELEKSRHRRDILEMVRASGRGDMVIRGTAGQSSNSFILRQIFWASSTESGLSDEADQARFLTLEIDKTPRFELPNVDRLRELGQDAAAVALRSITQAKMFLDRLTENCPDGVHPRVCETFAVPCAMYVASKGGDLGEALRLMLETLDLVTEEVGEIEQDYDELFHDLMTASVPLSGGKQASVIELIRRRGFDEEFHSRLAHVGISVSRDGSQVFINRKLAQRKLLGEEWRGKRIDQILMRKPGARRVQKWFGPLGNRQAIEIPVDGLQEVDFADSTAENDRNGDEF